LSRCACISGQQRELKEKINQQNLHLAPNVADHFRVPRVEQFAGARVAAASDLRLVRPRPDRDVGAEPLSKALDVVFVESRKFGVDLWFGANRRYEWVAWVSELVQVG